MKKNIEKQATKKTTKKAESGLSEYRKQFIDGVNSYIASRLSHETATNKLTTGKKREIQEFSRLNVLSDNGLQLLKDSGFQPADFKNIRKSFYAKAQPRAALVIDAIANGVFDSTYNCLGSALLDLKRLAKKTPHYVVKNNAFHASSLGNTGGASPAASMLNCILTAFKLSVANKENHFTLTKTTQELIAKIKIICPKVYND